MGRTYETDGHAEEQKVESDKNDVDLVAKVNCVTHFIEHRLSSCQALLVICRLLAPKRHETRKAPGGSNSMTKAINETNPSDESSPNMACITGV